MKLRVVEMKSGKFQVQDYKDGEVGWQPAMMSVSELYGTENEAIASYNSIIADLVKLADNSTVVSVIVESNG